MQPLNEAIYYLYAIADTPHISLDGVSGIDGALPLAIAYETLAAIVSPLSTTSIATSEQNLWTHETVLETLMNNHTILPVRFGTALVGEQAVSTILAQHYENFIANIERVRGCVEISLRVLWDEKPEPSQTATPSPSAPSNTTAKSGRDYMLHRLAEEQLNQQQKKRAEALATTIAAKLQPLAVAWQHRILLTPRMPLTSAYLVAKERVPHFQTTIKQLTNDYGELQFLCTGPWAPYSFVESLQKSRDVG